MTTTERFVNSLMKKDNVKAHKCLEVLLKKKCTKKIAKVLKK